MCDPICDVTSGRVSIYDTRKINVHDKIVISKKE